MKLCESAVMIALATILSLIKLADLPAGGSITPASMLPILIIAYRHGTLWGFLTGTVHGVMQFLLGSSVLSYVSGAASVAAVIILDYFLAFAFIGLGGLFRKVKDQKMGLAMGALAASIVRYLCHVISGATVWAGLSIPTASALSYSLVYNATYMIPEALVLMAASFYIASGIDFRPHRISPIRTEKKSFPAVFWLRIVSGGALCFALIFDIVSVFPHLQDSDSGTFANGIASVDWLAVALVSAFSILLAIILRIFAKSLQNKASS